MTADANEVRPEDWGIYRRPDVKEAANKGWPHVASRVPPKIGEDWKDRVAAKAKTFGLQKQQVFAVGLVIACLHDREWDEALGHVIDEPGASNTQSRHDSPAVTDPVGDTSP